MADAVRGKCATAPFVFLQFASLPRSALLTILALAVAIMSNGAVTGATFDIDGGQQLI